MTGLQTVIFAHGLAVEVEDLPLPLSAFYWAAGIALVLSFVVLAVGLHRIAPGKLVPRAASPGAGVEWRPSSRAWTIVGGALGIAWLVAALATTLFGGTDGAGNPGPNLVFVLAWIGTPIAALVVGRAALALHGPLALAKLGGMRETTDTPAPLGMGVWVAWAGLLAFVWLELVYPTATHVRLLGGLLVLWTLLVLVASSRYGLRDVRERIDPFATYTRLLASLAPVWRDDAGRLRARLPLLGANRDVPAQPGLAALGTLLIGSVSYDGLTRTDWWTERVALATADLAREGVEPDLARIAFGSFGMTMLLLLTWAAFELAAWAAGRVGRLEAPAGTRLATLFVPSLLPIALAYVVAHYFSFFVVQVQDLVRLASDPFEQGWDLFGTADRKIRDLWIPSGTLVWMVQVVAIVVGHVAGLLLAHDRALELAPDARRANWSQLPMLVLMLLYTIAGLYFLSEGLQ